MVTERGIEQHQIQGRLVLFCWCQRARTEYNKSLSMQEQAPKHVCPDKSADVGTRSFHNGLPRGHAPDSSDVKTFVLKRILPHCSRAYLSRLSYGTCAQEGDVQIPSRSNVYD